MNRNGLLDFYHEQVHGTPLTKKEVECPEDGIMNIKQSRYDRSLNRKLIGCYLFIYFFFISWILFSFQGISELAG